jgi:DNA polymerase I
VRLNTIVHGEGIVHFTILVQETYLMASIANDEAIIKELTYGSGDIHSLTAYMSYSEIPRDTPIKEIKKKFHNLRQEAKGIE